MKSCDQVTPPQTSDAAALALAAQPAVQLSQVARTIALHSKVIRRGTETPVDGVSSMVKVAVVEELFPQSSLAVKVTTT